MNGPDVNAAPDAPSTIGTAIAVNAADALGVVVADEFNALIRRDSLDVDHEPFRSPDDAISVPSLVVAGSVTGIRDGMAITAPVGEVVPVEISDNERKELPAVDRPSESLPESRSLGRFVTVELTVDQIVAGSGPAVGDQMLIQLQIAPSASLRELEAAAPKGPALFMLDDVTNWTPTDNAVFDRPRHLERQAETYIPYTGGIWFTTSNGIGGPFVSGTDLPESFGSPQSVEDFVTVLIDAADK